MTMTLSNRKIKPNCSSSNVACGRKCQPKHYRCPSEKSKPTAAAINKMIKALSTIDNVYLNFVGKLDPANKKAARAAIGKDKLLKKQLLLDEEKAWVFVRLYREMGRLLKAGNDSEANYIKETLKSIASGDEKVLEQATKKLKESISSKKKVSGKISDIIDSITTVIMEKPYLRENIETLFLLASNEKINEDNFDDFQLNDRVSSYYLKSRIEKIINANPEISEIEAKGLISWVDNGFEEINKVIYANDEEFELMGEEDRSYGIAAGIRAMQAINKLRPKYRYSPSNLEKLNKSFPSYLQERLRDNGELSRTLRINDNNIDNFLSPYLAAAASPSKSHIEQTFFATTASARPFPQAQM